MRRYFLILLSLTTLLLGGRILFQGAGLNYVWEKEKAFMSKANTKEKYDLLVLGDSRLYHAVNPDILKTESDQKALNFSFASVSYTKHYLDRAIPLVEQGGHVYLGLTAEAFTNFDEERGLTSYEVRGPLWFHLGLKWLRLHWPNIDLKMYLKQGYLPLFKDPPKVGQDTYHANGMVESAASVSLNNQDMANSYQDLFKNYKIEDFILTNVTDAVQIWTKNGIKVSAFWACFDKQVCEVEAKALGEGKREQINHALQEAGAKILNIEGKFATFDGDHLIGPEAIRFSHYLKNLNAK